MGCWVMPNGSCAHKDIGTIKATLTSKLLIPVTPLATSQDSGFNRRCHLSWVSQPCTMDILNILNNSLLWGVVLCIVRWSATSLASPYEMPWHPPLSPGVSTRNVSSRYPVFPESESPQLDPSGLKLADGWWASPMRDTSSFLVVWLDPGITFILPTAEGFPGGSVVKKLPARRLRFDSWVRKIL